MPIPTIDPTKNVREVRSDYYTGEITGYIYSGDSIRTKEQTDFYQKKLNQTEAQKDYGPFTWMLYNSQDGILKNLTASTITRLIYMATFLGYDGYLVHDNYKTLTKEQLKKKINVSNREFNYFWKEVTIDNKIIYEDNTRVFIDKNYFMKGELSENIIKNNDIIRIAAKGVRSLYENVDTTRSHKSLSYLFKIIPFINKEWNIACKNVSEKERDFIDCMPISEFCNIVGYDKSKAKRLINTLSKITFNGEHALVYVTMDFKINEAKIVMNPNLYWAGSNWEHVKYLSGWFSS